MIDGIPFYIYEHAGQVVVKIMSGHQWRYLAIGPDEADLFAALLKSAATHCRAKNTILSTRGARQRP